jgi:flagellar hook-basal body complex protein FliE
MPIANVAASQAVQQIAAPLIGSVTSTQQTNPTSAASFGNVLSGAMTNLQNVQQTSNELAIKAVTGDLNDIHDATIAATRSAVTLELITAVRNKGVEAFQEIMRMQA